MAELRKDPVTGRWVIISTTRGKRPNHFNHEVKDMGDPSACPFCPGNESKTPPEISSLRRDSSGPNSPGWQIRVIPNKYPALGIDEPLTKKGVGMYDLMAGFGAHEVVIETPDHHKAIHDLSIEEIKEVLTVYQNRLEDLHRDVRFRYVLIFKNEGPQAGATLSHSHSQIIATPVTPIRVKEELQGAERYFHHKERCLYCDVMHQEKDFGIRIVYENDYYISFCPFASRFPFELIFLPKYHQMDFYASRSHLHEMAQAFKITLDKLSLALNKPQYNYIIHTAPNRFSRRGYWHTIQEDFHWHIEIMPRLTKVAGFEWGSGFYINPTPPEDAAKYLREISVNA
ncbi:MAG: galactose-1-phosphate uridylyltransferase [Candidatus Omnitrophica bacterium]|nr:galactose-1-phosphate uridylyltransferase [Candidatus Omnitrophota bacterium]